MTPPREPIFNLPGVILALVAVMALIHAVVTLTLSPDRQMDVLLVFSFIPARYSFAVLADESWWTGWGAAIWSFVTYAFLHGSVTHLVVNSIWFFAFGTPVARRFGTKRFLIFFCVTAAAGAVAHLVTHYGEMRPIVGASAAISGAMAAALRFIFARGGALGVRDRDGPVEPSQVPAASLSETLRDTRALAFIAVWFGVNIIFGAGAVSLTGDDQAIAWEAHIGGFLMGLLGFSLFDPVRPFDADAKFRRGAQTDVPADDNEHLS